MTTLVVTNAQIASAMGIAGSTFRCFRMASAPRDLMYEPLSTDHPNGRHQRAYHLSAVMEWIKRAAPHRATPEFESRLMAAAAKNMQTMEAA